MLSPAYTGSVTVFVTHPGLRPGALCSHSLRELVDACVDSPKVRTSIDDLLIRKRSGRELDREPKINVLSDFIDAELSRLEKLTVPERVKPNYEKLNEIFRDAIRG